jgi:PAS domain S-box-containing protein
MEEVLRASEQKFEKIFHASPQGFSITAFEDGRCLECNETACLMTGYSREELIGRSIFEINLYENPENALRIRNLVAEQGTINNYNLKFRRKSGEIRNGLVSVCLIEFEGKRSLLSTILDVTDLHRTQESLRESEERLRFVLEGTSDGIWDWNIESGQVYFNTRYYTMLGYDPGEFPAAYESWLKLLHPDEVKPTERALQRAIENHTPFIIESRLKAKNGEWRYILSRGRVVESDSMGKAIRLAGSHTDITERKRTEQALEKRIIALTLPPSDVRHISMEDLFNLSDLQNIQDLFAKTCGVAAIITRPDGAPITQPSNFTDLCSGIIRKNSEGLRKCKNSDAMIGRYNPSGPNIHPCLSAGLCNAGTSITVGGHHVANWLIGQVRNETIDEEKITEYAREIGADEAAFRAAFHKVPIMPRKQFENVAHFLFALAKQISSTAFQNVQQARFISERKHAEETLRKYESIVSTSHDLMGLIGRGYVYEAVNQSFLKAHSKKREEIVGRTVPEVVGEDRFQLEIKPRLDQAFSGKTINYVMTYDFLGIGRRTMSVNYFPMYEEAGKVEGVVLNIRDITEAQKMEERLIQSQKMESIGTLAGGVAHEINNPINGIMNYAQLIIDRVNKISPAVELAGEIIHESERIASIVRNLLTFARHENQIQGSEHISDILSSVLSLIRTVIRHDQIDLEVDIEEGLPPLSCRSQQIQQVLMNLLTNARDALNERYPEYGPEKRIRVMARLVKKENKKIIRTTVEDYGVGILPSIIDKIFDPFFTTKTKKLGTGLGLSISYGIIKDHGGVLIAESEPGIFTRFHMDLPVNN